MQFLAELSAYASDERKKSNQWFFKTGKGEYGEGDVFLGVAVPDIRRVAKIYRYADLIRITPMIRSQFHEARLLCAIIIADKAKRAWRRKELGEMKKIADFFSEEVDGFNNWDIVDSSVPYVVGYSLEMGLIQPDVLKSYARSSSLWKRRIAIIGTFASIRYENNFELTMEIAEMLLEDRADLIHKAVGWMLREVWNRDNELTQRFIQKHYHNMPRTMLRYAIEKMPEDQRKQYLRGEF